MNTRCTVKGIGTTCWPWSQSLISQNLQCSRTSVKLFSTTQGVSESSTALTDASEHLRQSTHSLTGQELPHSLAATASKKRLSPYIPNSFLEHWDSDLSQNAPSLSQRKFANRFFETHAPKLLFTAASLHQVSFTDVPEVAFLGRSNVGKSTLLNALLGRGVAHVSAKPGRTRTLNAWAAGGSDRVGDKWRLTVLDMPGYGEGSRAEWGKTIQKYLAQRKELKRAFVLINAVHGMKDSDKQVLEMLRQASIPHQIVLSKADGWLTAKGGILSTKSDVSSDKLRRMFADPEVAAKMKERVDHIVDGIRAESRGDRRQRELPAIQDVLACSGEGSKLPGQPPEARNTLGITALRWSILRSIGITSTKLVKDEMNISFDGK